MRLRVLEHRDLVAEPGGLRPAAVTECVGRGPPLGDKREKSSA